MAIYEFAPFDTLISGNFFGGIYEFWAYALGQTIIFQIAFATICLVIWARSKNVIAASLAGLFMSLAMVSWPGTVDYLGPEGQFIAYILLVVALLVILLRVGISVAFR